jgi:hypothetical protein
MARREARPAGLSAPYPAKCLCGAVQFRVTEEPLTLYACHCTDCQKRSGSAFGLSMWVPRAAIEVTAGETALQVLKGADGRGRPGRMCAQCGARLWSEPEKRATLAVVRAGTLDDTSWLRPIAHIWTRSAQPWFALPEGVPTYATQPDDFRDLIRLWQSRRDH